MIEQEIAPKTCVLMSPPGAGKTTMIAMTAPEPIYFIDCDRKISAMSAIQDAIHAGRDVRWDDLGETFTEDTLAARAIDMAMNKKPSKKPLGWLKFSEMIDGLARNPKVKDAKTIAIDSLTRLGTHLSKLVLYSDPNGNSAMSPRNWGHFLMMWQETLIVLCDEAKRLNKHLIMTVHERTAEIPGAGMKVKKIRGPSGNIERDFTGNFDLKIAASIPGQFGTELASYVEEMYALDVRIGSQTGKPNWVCRVKPDGRRDLRTACNVDFEECIPDFNKIWKFKK